MPEVQRFVAVFT